MPGAQQLLNKCVLNIKKYMQLFFPSKKKNPPNLKYIQVFYIYLHLLNMCVHIQMWRSENDLWESVLSF